tara:strand:+ start:3553 stop:4029 length:477 start_codon:yes stop_codon:yes gene_type:complete
MKFAPRRINRKHMVIDRDKYILDLKNKFDSILYYRIFKEHYSDIDTIYVLEVRNEVFGIHPLITLYKTFESDKPVSYRELHLLDSSLNLCNVMSLDYSIDYDLFDSESKFINDSTIEVRERRGLGYDNDSVRINNILLRLTPKGTFDTLSVDSKLGTY